MRNAAILQQPNDRWHAHGDPSGMQEVPVFFFRHGDALEHEHDRASRRTNVNRLVGRVQHQHGLMQRMAIAFLMHPGRSQHGCRQVRPDSATVIV